MIIKAINKWNINIKNSIFIGDKLTDKFASNKCGIKFYFKKNIPLIICSLFVLTCEENSPIEQVKCIEGVEHMLWDVCYNIEECPMYLNLNIV